MIKLAVSALLLVSVSCKRYPGDQKYLRAPALDLRTGGVSEFKVDGRTYGTDLPPLLTGKANIPTFYGNGDQLLGDSFLNLERSRGNSFQSVAGVSSVASSAIPNDFQFRNRHSGIKRSGIPFLSDHISRIRSESKGILGYSEFTRQDFGPLISNSRQFRNRQSGIKSGGISFHSDHISGTHQDTSGISGFGGITRQDFASSGPIFSNDRQLRNRKSGIKSSGISFYSDHRSGIYPEFKGISEFDGFTGQDADITVRPAVSRGRPFRNQHSGIKPSRPSYIPDGNLRSGPLSGSISDITYSDSLLLDTGRRRESRPWIPKTPIYKGEAHKTAFPPVSFPAEPISTIPFSVNSRSTGGGEWKRGSVGPAALPYSPVGTHSSGIGHSGIKAQTDIKFGSFGLAQGRPFDSEILNSKSHAFTGGSHQDSHAFTGGSHQDSHAFIGGSHQDSHAFIGGSHQDRHAFIGGSHQDSHDFIGGSHQGESIGSSYPVDHRETKFDTSLINIPKHSKNNFDSFGFPQSQIIHGDDLVSFGRTNTFNVPGRTGRSFESTRQISVGRKFPSVYQPDRNSIAQFDTDRISSRRAGSVWEQSIGDSEFERNILSRNPRVGKIPTGGKHYKRPKVL